MSVRAIFVWAVSAIAGVGLAAPAALAARAIPLNESARLHLTGRHGFTLNEQGPASGTVSATIYVHLKIVSTDRVTAEVNLYPHGGSITGLASAGYQPRQLERELLRHDVDRARHRQLRARARVGAQLQRQHPAQRRSDHGARSRHGHAVSRDARASRPRKALSHRGRRDGARGRRRLPGGRRRRNGRAVRAERIGQDDAADDGRDAARADRGKRQIGGRDVSSLSEREASTFRLTELGFIHQSFDLLPGVSAIDNAVLKLLDDDALARGPARGHAAARSGSAWATACTIAPRRSRWASASA